MTNHRIIHEGEPDGIRRLPLCFSSTPVLSPSPSSMLNLSSSEVQSQLNTGTSMSSYALQDTDAGSTQFPSLIHKWEHDYSIISVIATPIRGLLFCGTQDAKILVFDILTFEKRLELIGHTGSVLCLDVSSNENYLFSGGSDSLVKVWDLDTFTETHTIYSLVDIGDIFSIAWSNSMKSIFFGAQNASILSAHLEDTTISKTNPNLLPNFRYDKFFDSKGPGGSLNKLQKSKKKNYENKSKLIEIPGQNIIKYAHNGYVYSMKIITTHSSDFAKQYASDFKSILLSAGGDGKVNIWGVDCCSDIKLLHSLDNEDSVLSISLKESYLYCGLTDGQVKLWDLNTLQQIRTFSNPEEGDIVSVATHNDCIFKANRKGVTKTKMIGDKLSDWVTPDGPALTVSILQRNGNTFLMTGADKSVCLYNITQVGDELSLDRPMSSEEHKKSVVDISNDDMLSQLSKMISYKTVSKKPELYLDDSRKCASFLRSLFMKFGAVSKLLPVPDCNPIVYACFKKNNYTSETENEKIARILWYGHYDVVEAESTEAWDTPPFEMTAKNGSLYARGVSDNKGPILASIYSVAELYRQGKLNSDIVFLIEGEEESGSLGFQDAINDHRDLVGPIDWILLSNSYWLDDTTPCLNYGLRGVINASVKITSSKPDRHSGVDGGVSREATIDLVHLLSKLMNDEGKVLVPDFYEPVKPLTENEKTLYRKITEKVANGVSVDTLLAKWRNPSITIHKIIVSGPNNNTVIPQCAEASVSVRIVPYQNLEEVKKSLIAYVTEIYHTLKTDNHLDVDIFHQAEPWLGDPTNAAFQILKGAVELEWGVEPLFIREGGSIPSIRFLEKCFDAPAAQIPCGQSSDSAHLNNEKLRVMNLYKLRSILTKTFTELPSRR